MQVDYSVDEMAEAIETVLNELEEYEKTLDIFDERKYRKKYLEEERAKRPNLLYPDADEIYERYFQQRAELEMKAAIINEMADTISSIMTGVTVIQKQFEEEYCEFMKSDEDCCWKTDKECSDCIKEYFIKKGRRN